MGKRRMKRKVIVAMAIACMVCALWQGIPVRSGNPVIKVGVIRPIGLAEGMGTEGGCKVAEWWINGKCGDVVGTPHPIVINGQPYDIQFIYEDEHAVDMRPDLARQAAVKLITIDHVDFIMGGTMDECWHEVQEECADRKVLCLNTGCTWYKLMDCGYGTPYGDPEPCGRCIRCDYQRYKYIFRTGPCNSTNLAFVILYQVNFLLQKLARLYGAPVKTAVMAEDLDWNVELYDLLTGGEVIPPEVANIVYTARTPYDCSDFTPYLTPLKNSGAHLLITLYYMEAGITLTMQLHDYPGHIPVLVTGALVPAQMQEFWDTTGGKCEYVTTMTAAGGTRTPVVTVPAPITTQDFWDKFIEINGYTPTHNGYCAFDTVMMMKEVLEAAGINPPLDAAKTDALIPYIELVDRQGIRGKMKFTGPNPGNNGNFTDYDPNQPGNQPYPYLSVNPDMKGTLHDVFGNELDEHWVEGYTRPWLVQWLAGKMEIVHPTDQLFSKKVHIPPWMYELAMWDINVDGIIDIEDIYTAALAYGTMPGMPGWNIETDINGDGIVDIEDIYGIALNYGRMAPQWPLP